MRPAVLLLTFALACPAFARDELRAATAEELALQDVSWAAGAAAVILDWRVVHDDETSLGSEYYRIKILKPEGKSYGDVVIPYVPRQADVRDVRARTIRPDGSIVPFDGRIYDKVIVRSGRTRLMQKTFTLPAVEPGAIVEYRFTRTWPKSRLFANRWTVQHAIPLAHASFSIRPDRRYASTCASVGLPKGQSARTVADRYEAELHRIPAFASEPFAPPDREIMGQIELVYTFRGNVANYWTETGGILSDIVERFIGNRRPIRETAHALVAGAPSATDQLRRLYERVQQLENLSFEEKKTGQEAKRLRRRHRAHVHDVLTLGYGTREELNRLFVALARGAGFEASIVMVPDRDERFFNRRLADFRQLASEVAVVRVDNGWRFFDPGTPFNPFSLLPWENAGVDGLRIEAGTSGQWLVTPDPAPMAPTTRRTADLRLDGDVLHGTVRVVYSGQDALQQRLAALHQDEAENRKRLEARARNWFPDGATVALQTIENASGTEEPLVVTFAVELPHIGTATASRIVVPLAVFSAARRNPFSAENRQYDIYFPYAWEIQDVVTLSVPDGYGVENVPAGVSVDEAPFRYGSSWKDGGSAVTLERTITRPSMLVNAMQYPKVRTFYSRVAAADQEAIVFRRTP